MIRRLSAVMLATRNAWRRLLIAREAEPPAFETSREIPLIVRHLGRPQVSRASLLAPRAMRLLMWIGGAVAAALIGWAALAALGLD